jgi:hypothetical protein
VSPMSHQRAERPDGTVEWCDPAAGHDCLLVFRAPKSRRVSHAASRP